MYIIRRNSTVISSEWFLSLEGIIAIMRLRTTYYALFDLLSVTAVFLGLLTLKLEPLWYLFQKYFYSFFLFMGIWFFISVISKKYRLFQITDQLEIISRILLCNLFVLGIATTLMYLIRIDFYSRAIVLGTIVIVTALELVLSMFDYFIRTAIIEPPDVIATPSTRKRQLLREVFTQRLLERKSPVQKAREDAVLVEIDQDAFEFVFRYAPIESAETLVISTTSGFNIDMQMSDEFEAIVNLKRINDIRYVNKFFESANRKLCDGGLFIDYVETKNLRKKRILAKFPPVLNYMAYSVDFVIKRIFPKFLLTKGLYFFLTRGQNRVFTKAETFGRLYSCGFEIVDEKQISKHLFFIARKVSEPFYPENPTYGPLIKLKRVGKNGKMINVYKLRTMHPYAEYLQEYIYMKEGLQEGGKFKDDFRVSTLGRIFRMFWIDELPMLINLLKGELKLVGVRPLSKHYFSLYTLEHQERRVKYKPGLVPPFYADNPKTLEDIMASEQKYFDAYDKHPLFTDFRYFFKAIFNIVFKKSRSN